MFAPFVDATLFPTPRLLDYWEGAGQRWLTLAFITADAGRGGAPAWGGVIGMEKQYMMDQVGSAAQLVLAVLAVLWPGRGQRTRSRRVAHLARPSPVLNPPAPCSFPPERTPVPAP